MQDWRGVTLKVGDLVVYTVRRGSVTVINEAEVNEILPLSVDGEAKVKLKWLRSNQLNLHSRHRKGNLVVVAADNVTMIGRSA